MNSLITTLRRNVIVGWLFALSMGLIFRNIYGMAKRLTATLFQKVEFISSVPESQFPLLTIVFNFAVDFVSSLTAAALCGSLLVYAFQERARVFCLGSVGVFLLLDSRLRKFWKYPEASMQISALAGPILAIFVFILTVCLMVKLKKYGTGGQGHIRI